MTSDARSIETLIGNGDYFEALGVGAGAAATDIAVAAARLAAEHPAQARVINAVASVLRDPQQREVYLIACQERDAMVYRELGAQLHQAIPEARRRIWEEIQRLLRCTFELGEVNIGPRGARSLARRHEWIREALVNSAFPVLMPSPVERRAQRAYRTLVFEQDCRECGGERPAGCDCHDLYRFDIPSASTPGTLLGAPGERTGRFTYMILDRAVVAPRPYRAVTLVYQTRRFGAHNSWVESDITLDEARRQERSANWGVALGYPATGIVLGLLISTWLTGLIAALPLLAAAAVINLGSTTPHRRAYVYTSLALGAQPIVGALAGSSLATTLTGLCTGLATSSLIVLLLLLRRRIGA
jgi:hypothetical protein